MNRRKLAVFIAALSGSGGAAPALPTYAEILRDTYGASEVYPLTNIPSGTTIHAFVSGAHDGTLSGWTLQNTAGPVTGTLAPTLDGTTANSDIGSLALIWNGGMGGMFIFGKVSNVADWSDGVSRFLVSYKVDNSNYFQLSKHGTLGLEAWFSIGGITKVLRSAQTTTDWFSLGLTWKDSANGNEGKMYVNGAQVGATQTGFGAWAGTPTILRLGIASANSSVWKGGLAYNTVKFGSIWSPTEMANAYAARLTGGPDVNP